MLKGALDDAALWERLRREPLFIGLDYDGTLTPIVDRPEDALLAPEMRETLAQVIARGPLALVSGRDLADLRRFVQLDGLLYAGSHGFDMALPPGSPEPPVPGVSYLGNLDEAETLLRAALAPIPGTRVERKRYAIAAHYRQAGVDAAPAVQFAVEAARRPGLKVTDAKMVLELRPAVDWHKGAAFRWLQQALAPRTLPIFIGDDATDEDAFRALPAGITARVGEGKVPTAARYALASPAEVYSFLTAILEG